MVSVVFWHQSKFSHESWKRFCSDLVFNLLHKQHNCTWSPYSKYIKPFPNFYVSVNGHESYMKVTWFGIIQGSILCPLLYAIFISPLFHVENLTCYADDKFPLVEDRNRLVLVQKMQVKLERIINWLTKSGMVVNESKTDLCIFHTRDCPPVVIELNGKFIISKKWLTFWE